MRIVCTLLCPLPSWRNDGGGEIGPADRPPVRTKEAGQDRLPVPGPSRALSRSETGRHESSSAFEPVVAHFEYGRISDRYLGAACTSVKNFLPGREPCISTQLGPAIRSLCFPLVMFSSSYYSSTLG